MKKLEGKKGSNRFEDALWPYKGAEAKEEMRKIRTWLNEMPPELRGRTTQDSNHQHSLGVFTSKF